MNFDNQIIYYTFHQTSFGKFALAASNKGLKKVNLPGTTVRTFIDLIQKFGKPINTKNTILENACSQLDEYLSGHRKKFDIPFDIENSGTRFQKDVWNILLSIPYGKTLTYKDVAIKLDNLGAIRAVGQANKSNPIAVFIPCHRVIGKNNLGGYAGKDQKNIDLKAKLLELESPKKLEKFLS